MTTCETYCGNQIKYKLIVNLLVFLQQNIASTSTDTPTISTTTREVAIAEINVVLKVVPSVAKNTM